MLIQLETLRLTVTKPSLQDLDRYIQLHLDPEVRKLMYTRAKDVNEVEKWLQNSIEHQKQHGFSVGCVYEKSTGEFIGRAGLVRLNEKNIEHEVEIDCFLLKPYWRKGYGKELLHAFFQWAFNHSSINKIAATVYPINVNGKGLAECVGMEFIGNKPYHGADFLWYEIQKEKYLGAMNENRRIK